MINPIKNRILINQSEFNHVLKTRFGLSIDKDSIYKYVDNFSGNQRLYNINNPKIFTIGFKDKINKSYSNIYGDFYNNHAKKQTELYKDFKEFVNTYTFTIGKHFFF